MPSSNLFGSTSVSTIASCIVNSLDAIRATATHNFVADVGTESFSSLNHASYYPNGAVRLHATEDRRTRRPSTDSEQTHRTRPVSWDARSYYVSDDTDNATYGRAIPAAPWEQLQYRPSEASAVRGIRPSSAIVDDVEYRTVASVWDQPTRTVTAEDLRRAYNSLDGSRTHITSLSYDEQARAEYMARLNAVSAQPTRPRITFGEL